MKKNNKLQFIILLWSVDISLKIIIEKKAKVMKTKEYEFYNELKNWDFSKIKYEEEYLTKWDMYDILRENCNSQSKVLDLGTGGGEKVLTEFPEVSEILATDFSEEMIKTANDNLKECNKRNITFRQMDNLKMDTPNDYFDVVVARHTCIDAKQIYKTLKSNGILILRGVDKLDCWELKKLYGKGQAYNDIEPISFIDYENILDDFSEINDNVKLKKEDIDLSKIDKYIESNSTDRGILLTRRYYGITARK